MRILPIIVAVLLCLEWSGQTVLQVAPHNADLAPHPRWRVGSHCATEEEECLAEPRNG
jgi:hypothetical protein